MAYPKCVGISLQSKGREVGQCLNEYKQDLTFDSNLSDCSCAELHAIAKIQFPYYRINSTRVSASEPTILRVVYIVDSSD